MFVILRKEFTCIGYSVFRRVLFFYCDLDFSYRVRVYVRIVRIKIIAKVRYKDKRRYLYYRIWFLVIRSFVF